MVQFIVGNKGKGKTKYLLDRANSDIKEASGNIVYLDKSSKKMYELNNKIRLIDVSSFPLRNSSEFVGFILGIISQDHDLEWMFLDSFLKLSKLEEAEDAVIEKTIAELDNISKQYHVDFVLSISKDKTELSADLQDKIIVAL